VVRIAGLAKKKKMALCYVIVECSQQVNCVIVRCFLEVEVRIRSLGSAMLPTW